MIKFFFFRKSENIIDVMNVLEYPLGVCFAKRSAG
jgi:hypothetical protein